MPILPDAKKYLHEETHEQRTDRAIARLLTDVQRDVAGRKFNNAEALLDYMKKLARYNYNQFGEIKIILCAGRPSSGGHKRVLHDAAIRLYALDGKVERAYDIIPLYNSNEKSVSIAIIPVGHKLK